MYESQYLLSVHTVLPKTMDRRLFVMNGLWYYWVTVYTIFCLYLIKMVSKQQLKVWLMRTVICIMYLINYKFPEVFQLL